MIATAIAAASLAGGSQISPSPDARGSATLLHVAFMMGSRSTAWRPHASATAADPRAFDGWDPTADNPELEHLLGLKQLTELSRATVTMPPDHHFVSLTVDADQRRYELAIDTADTRDRVVYLGVTVREDGRDVSQPRVGLRLGQKGVVCARVARAEGEAFVFFVLQMDEL
jgi:hypothetical protein